MAASDPTPLHACTAAEWLRDLKSRTKQTPSLPTPTQEPSDALAQAVLLSKRNERERNVLFNDALNTFYLRLYGVRHIWLRTILIVRKETRCRHIGYSYRLTARVHLYAPSHRQDSTYHGLCYTSRGALAGTRNSSTKRNEYICILLFVHVFISYLLM